MSARLSTSLTTAADKTVAQIAADPALTGAYAAKSALSAYVPIPGGLATVAGATTPLTRRASMTIGAEGGGGTNTTFVDINQRLAVVMPVTTTRWRFRARNANRLANTTYTGALTFQPIYFSAAMPTSATGVWAGTFSSAPTQALPGFTTPADGTDYVSGWVTDASLQFPANTLRGLSVGFTAPSGTALVKGGLSCYLTYGTSGSLASSAAGAASPTTGTGGGSAYDAPFVDMIIEYEYVGANLIGLFIGDSITLGYIGGTNANFPGPATSWPSAAGLRQGFAVYNAGVGGSQSSTWASASALAWTRFDFATVVPDFAVISLGTNDANSSIALATYQSNMASIVANVRALGIQRIYVATAIPRNFTGTPETLRTSYNAWLRQLPFGVVGCFDFDGAMALQATPATVDTRYMETYPHPNAMGYQRMADVVNVRAA